MNRLLLSIALVFLVCPAYADLTAPVRMVAPITDPTMVVVDRGAKLELFPMKRAVPTTDSAGRAVMHHVVRASADAAIGPHQLGVVFNHSMQQQGYISGEIVFKIKVGHTADSFSSSLFPGLKKITNPEVYVVNARTPAEFLKVFKRLQARSDLEWVEPSVIYGPKENVLSVQ
jgi:hypothetical protein